MYYKDIETNPKILAAYVEGRKYDARKRLDEVAAKKRVKKLQKDAK